MAEKIQLDDKEYQAFMSFKARQENAKVRRSDPKFKQQSKDKRMQRIAKQAVINIKAAKAGILATDTEVAKYLKTGEI